MRSKTWVLLGFWVVALAAGAIAWREARSNRQIQINLEDATRARHRLAMEIARIEQRDTVVDRHRADLELRLQELNARYPATAGTRAEALAVADRTVQAYLDLAADPKMMNLLANTLKARLRIRYSPLYLKLGLSPAQIARFELLQANDGARTDDIRVAAATLKLSESTPEIAGLLSQDKDQFQTEATGLLGAEGFRQLQGFDGTAEERRIVNDLAGALMFSDTPLSSEQKNQLIETMRASRASVSAAGATTEGKIDWDQIPARAAAFLTPPQVLELGSSLANGKYRDLQNQYVEMVRAWVKESPPGK